MAATSSTEEEWGCSGAGKGVDARGGDGNVCVAQGW